MVVNSYVYTLGKVKLSIYHDILLTKGVLRMRDAFMETQQYDSFFVGNYAYLISSFLFVLCEMDYSVSSKAPRGLLK